MASKKKPGPEFAQLKQTETQEKKIKEFYGKRHTAAIRTPVDLTCRNDGERPTPVTMEGARRESGFVHQMKMTFIAMIYDKDVRAARPRRAPTSAQ
jgi:hypothetical protein